MDTESPAPGKPSLSVIVPTYREAGNLPALLERLERVRKDHGLAMEVLIMDDDSRDGTERTVERLGKPWVRLIVRTSNRGLSAAVVEGFRLAQNEVVVVMDADLSHPPEKIPEMLDALSRGNDFVLGSRYVAGGETEEGWGFLRWINSQVATLLARPFTSLRDPMSGFFMLRRETVERGAPLNPIGYKIGLEILVKCPCERQAEVPILFSKRNLGESKLTLREQLRYLQHLRRLFLYKFGNWAYFVHFAAVGFSGTLVNLAILTCLLYAQVPFHVAAAAAILVSMFSNFVLNRRLTFSYARSGNWWRQLAGFMATGSIGSLVNYATTILTFAAWPFLQRFPQMASLIGIAAGLTFNFFTSRYVVFRKNSAK